MNPASRNLNHDSSGRGQRPRILAVDWSGDATVAGQRRKIWLADWNHGQFALSASRTREETVGSILEVAERCSGLVVGLDFSFSFPAWFVREQGCASAPEFWARVAAGRGEEWLRNPNEFCWGRRKGSRCPADHVAPKWRGLRRTEIELLGKGIRSKSTFQIGGAGAVGTGSLRGIPWLMKLKEAGFSIWPFDPPSRNTVVEIYPRVFTGRVRVSRLEQRKQHLATAPFGGIASSELEKACRSEDAFDALCTAAGMSAHAHEFALLPQAIEPDDLIEGWIWAPQA